jgi:uncharacterized protein
VGAVPRRNELPGKVIAESDCVQQLRELMANEYVPDSPTHDLTHLARVASLGEQMCRNEGGDRLTVVSAAWLHDLHRDAGQPDTDAGQPDTEFFVPPEQMDGRVRLYLAKAEVPDEIHDAILEAIHYTDRFSFSDRPIYATTIEAMILRDADCLDAIGAIGIARAFSFGGSHDIPLWEGASYAESSVYRQADRPTSTIRHFYDKLLRLAGEMETATGRELARQRGVYMETFVRQFMEEWREDTARAD